MTGAGSGTGRTCWSRRSGRCPFGISPRTWASPTSSCIAPVSGSRCASRVGGTGSSGSAGRRPDRSYRAASWRSPDAPGPGPPAPLSAGCNNASASTAAGGNSSPTTTPSALAMRLRFSAATSWSPRSVTEDGESVPASTPARSGASADSRHAGRKAAAALAPAASPAHVIWLALTPERSSTSGAGRRPGPLEVPRLSRRSPPFKARHAEELSGALTGVARLAGGAPRSSSAR